MNELAEATETANESTVKKPRLLKEEEVKRYSRHLILPEVGMAGQLKLNNAKVLCVGTGGLGSPLAMYLAAAGVGTLGLVDYDDVDYSNLQRQILHFTDDVGKSKLSSAARKLKAINPHINIIQHECMLNSENALEICGQYDVVADGTDNFATRYLINDACVLLGIPNVHSSIFRFDGQASIFYAKQGPCYRCLYPEPPPPGEVPSCAEGGVLGVLPGLLGIIQATEVIKFIIGQGDLLIGRLLMADTLEMSFRELRIEKNPDCPICGNNPTITELIDYDAFCGFGGEHKEREGGYEPIPIKALELKSLFDSGSDNYTLLDVRLPMETEVSLLGEPIVIPLQQLPEKFDRLPKDKEIIIYCLADDRSKAAAQKLHSAGYEKVRYLDGGLISWFNEVDENFQIF